MRAKPVNPTKRKLVRPSSCVTVEVSEPTGSARTRKKEREKGRGAGRNYTEPPKPSSCASGRWSSRPRRVSNVDIAGERERGSGRENSWPGCHGHRPHSSRHDECVNSQGGGTMVIPMEDWLCTAVTLCRPIRDANLLVAG